MNKLVFKNGRQYVLGYKYKHGNIIWECFDNLEMVNGNYKYIIKNSVNFKLFRNNGFGKYYTVFSKAKLIDITTKKLVKAIMASGQQTFIMENISNFRKKIERKLGRI